jgi:hypothetical protein
VAESARPIQQPGAGYSGTPLPRKLGIKPAARVALVRAPADFAQTLGHLPEGARLSRTGTRDLTIWFVRSIRELASGIERVTAAAGGGPLWIAWPKRASGVATDLSENAVRDAGLARGLVDTKVCAIDQTWSGLLFRRRR